MELEEINNFNNINNTIVKFFLDLDQDFTPPLTSRIDIFMYIKSIFDYNGRLILCKQETDIVGILGLCFDDPIFKYYIKYIGVSKDYRNQGIAKKLIRTAEDIFKDYGVNAIMIKTWSTNTVSNTTFQKVGFIKVSTQIDDRGKGIHTNVYKKDL